MSDFLSQLRELRRAADAYDETDPRGHEHARQDYYAFLHSKAPEIEALVEAVGAMLHAQPNTVHRQDLVAAYRALNTLEPAE